MGEKLAQSNQDFKEIYEKYYRLIYRICYVFMKNSADAEDCTADTFVKLLTSGVVFAEESKEKAWLSVTATNICKDRLKHWWKKKTAPIDEYSEKLYTTGIEHDDILEYVMKLPVKYKEIVILYYYEGYKTDEIAEMLKKPASTVRNNLREARMRLKKSIGGDFFE